MKLHEFIRTYSEKRVAKDFSPQDPSYVVLGTLILWLGWLCFNAGSSELIGENGEELYLISERALINSILAPSMGGLFTLLTKRYITREEVTTRLDF